MKFHQNKNRHCLEDDQESMLSTPVRRRKMQKWTALSTLTQDLSNCIPTVTTPVSNLNISLDDNFTNMTNETSGITNEADNNSIHTATPITCNIIANGNCDTAHQINRHIPFGESDESDNESSSSEETMSTDSDNENIPEIDYEEELRSRFYYYANIFYQQNNLTQEDGNAAENTFRYSLNIHDCEYSEENNTCVSLSPTESAVPFKSHPSACSTISENFSLVNDRDSSSNTSFTALKQVMPCSSSTVIDQSQVIPCSSSTVIDQSQTEIKLLSHENDNTSSQDMSSRCAVNSLSVVASSTERCTDISLDLSNGETSFYCENHNLHRTSTFYNLNELLVREQNYQTNEQNQATPKRTTSLFKALQNVKSVTKSLTKKSKSKHQEESEKEQTCGRNPALELTLQDKRTVARRFQKFRESFRRKDKQRIQTLANL